MRTVVILEHTTLRDCEQAPGVAFDVATKAAVLDALIAAGVRWVEVGIPAMGGSELEFVARAVERAGDATLVAWNRGVRADVDQSLDLGYRAVHIGLPASALHLRSGVGKDRDWLLRTAADLVAHAKDRGAFVSVGAEDIARTEIPFLQEYAGVLHAAGADRLRLSDTVGLLGPDRYAERVRAVVEAAPIDVQCHAHNDFGLGLANTLAGLEAGARYFHVTVNGMGGRAGTADLAQAALTLRRLYGVDVGVDMSRLAELSRLVARATRRPVLPWHPVVGNNVFARESGIHVNAMSRDTSTFEPFPPEEVGGERLYVLGKHSGRAPVADVLTGARRQPTETELTWCLTQLRELARASGGPVDAEDLLVVHDRVRAALATASSA